VTILVGVIVLYLILVKTALPEWDKSGQFGDTFGALTCIFTALGFAGVLYTIAKQNEDRTREARWRHEDTQRTNLATLISAAEARLQLNEKWVDYDPAGAADTYAKLVEYSTQLEILIKGRFQYLLTEEDIVEQFTRIPWFTTEQIKAGIPSIRRRLAVWGIANKPTLKLLLDNEAIRAKIRELYLRILERPEDAPFDPDALATWGGRWLQSGLSEESIQSVIKQLESCSEYQDLLARKYRGRG
jgi:hypothetical protein